MHCAIPLKGPRVMMPAWLKSVASGQWNGSTRNDYFFEQQMIALIALKTTEKDGKARVCNLPLSDFLISLWQNPKEGMEHIRGTLSQSRIITSAWDTKGWHGVRRGRNETSIPLPSNRRIHARLRTWVLPPYALPLQQWQPWSDVILYSIQAAELQHIRFFHWSHSATSKGFSWWWLVEPLLFLSHSPKPKPWEHVLYSNPFRCQTLTLNHRQVRCLIF